MGNRVNKIYVCVSEIACGIFVSFACDLNVKSRSKSPIFQMGTILKLDDQSEVQ